MFKTVLFPIDLSQDNIETTSKAIELIKNYPSNLTLLSVVKHSQDVSNQELTISNLKKTQEQIHEANINCDVIERQGEPVFVICNVADNLNVDLIIMGTNGINLEANDKSTPARVIQLVHCPVLVVP